MYVRLRSAVRPLRALSLSKPRSFLAAAHRGRRLYTSVGETLVGQCFIAANNGRDQQYRFSPGQAAASLCRYQVAPGQLIVEGSHNYPPAVRDMGAWSHLSGKNWLHTFAGSPRAVRSML
jgi:hypothetical protein